MRNAKLRKQIDVAELPELTQENIDNLEDVTGTVNPSKVSFGGGGPEVLKDWTTITSAANLLEGTDLGTTSVNNVTLEIKNLNGKSTAALGIVSLEFRAANNSAQNSPFGSKSRSEAFGIGNTAYDNLNGFVLMGSPYATAAILGGTVTALLSENQASNDIYLMNIAADFMAPTTEPSSLFMMKGQYSASFGNTGTRLPELWLTPLTPALDVPFTATYRLTRK